MTSVAQEIQVLTEYAQRLDTLSKRQTELLYELEPIEIAYRHGFEFLEAKAWNDHVEHGAKFPPERVRDALAKQQIPGEIVSRYARITSDVKRVEKEIRHITSLSDAHRSILSALKIEMEATQ